ncbi:uncharacterized protein BCR38DRAFT_420414 [Pseudomassariella vexata]|uniref:Uncharacterized protein n=1 Tax=Pseudomassariella vexata TaxID=1141098 RepID=A0A1Y2EET5_9PEZI|nr:uncharacterized protein BCR38DRAFT_420414 [Pseudomassariella vexata]ORY69917.1 hypothetical protein BCR38DRAFT_420414 [Pseudomassariella vexata]
MIKWKYAMTNQKQILVRLSNGTCKCLLLKNVRYREWTLGRLRWTSMTTVYKFWCWLINLEVQAAPETIHASRLAAARLAYNPLQRAWEVARCPGGKLPRTILSTRAKPKEAKTESTRIAKQSLGRPFKMNYGMGRWLGEGISSRNARPQKRNCHLYKRLYKKLGEHDEHQNKMNAVADRLELMKLEDSF